MMQHAMQIGTQTNSSGGHSVTAKGASHLLRLVLGWARIPALLAEGPVIHSTPQIKDPVVAEYGYKGPLPV